MSKPDFYKILTQILALRAIQENVSGRRQARRQLQQLPPLRRPQLQQFRPLLPPSSLKEQIFTQFFRSQKRADRGLSISQESFFSAVVLCKEATVVAPQIMHGLTLLTRNHV